MRACSLEVVRADISIPADVWPPINGVSYLFVGHDVGPAALRYLKLHEIGHRLAGDIEEPTMFVFDGPLPESEEVADLFALLGILDPTELEQGPDYVEGRIRELVPLADRGWQEHRVPRLARRVVTDAIRSISRAAMSLTIGVLAACGDSPTALDDAEPLEAFAWFDGVYADMEECSGVDGDFSQVRWYGVLNSIQHSDDSLEVLRDPFFSVEWRPPHAIYLGLNRVEGGSVPPGTYATGISVMDGSLRELHQTNSVSQSILETCGVPIL